jgi:TolA-binding protein
VALAAPIELVDDGQATSEHFLYSKVLDSFRTKDEAALRKSEELLEKSYPDSVFADNAAYLEAELALQLGDRNRALRLFDALLNRYPNGNKAGAAMYGKAMVLRESKRAAAARDVLRALRVRYPGSPEAIRAERELRGSVVGERAREAVRSQTDVNSGSAG